MNHEEFKELIPAYALNALSPSEDLEMRAHLDGCSGCRGLLKEHHETSALLALAAEPIQAPPRLRQSILAEAKANPPLRAPSPARARGARWLRPVGALAAAAMLALAGINLALVQRISTQRHMLDRSEQAVSLLGSASIHQVSMVSTDPKMPGAAGQIFTRPDGTGVIILSGLPQPEQGVYQLWVLKEAGPVPLDPFRPDTSGMAIVMVKASPDPASKPDPMAVTLEAREGLSAPKGPMVLHSA